MLLITERDFESPAGHKRIITVIHQLDVKVRELTKLVHGCMREAHQLEKELQGLD
jgi:hypothetical protein